jgi:hypothetical protein
MSDQTSVDSPTTNENLGVLGAQQAAAEKQARGNTPEPPTPNTGVSGASLAAEALSQANSVGGTPQEVVERAAVYLKFLKENNDG